MQRFRTRATTDGAAVAHLTALHRRLLAGAAATVMVWAAAPAERPAHAAEVPADGGDTTLRLERLSDLPTTVRLAVGKARLVETGGPGVRSRSQGWTFANDGLVLSEGDGVRMAGDRVENGAGAVILGRRGVVLGGDDATGTLSVDNAGTVLGAGGPGVRITGEAARLVNRTDALIGGIGGRAAVLRGGETSVDNQGRITSSSHVGLKMTADDDALLENGQTGLIIGTGRGAVVDGHAVTVDNAGAIAGARPADDQDGAARDALGLLARGDQVVVVNRATGLIAGDDQGLRALSDRGVLIDNAGIIRGLDGDGGDGTIRLVNRDTGVVMGGNGTVLAGAAVEIDNAGAFLAPDSISQPILSVFDSDETRIINRRGGVIDGSGVGIDVTGGDVELINDGFIRSGIQDDNGLGGLDIAVLITDAEDVLIENDGRIEGAYGIAVFTADEVEITNDSAGEIHAGYGNAVAVEADIVRVGNEGLIQSVFETGVEVVAGASGLVENTGVILGGETGVFGVADVMTVHNQGVITAGREDDDDRDPVAVDLTGGAVRLVNDDGGVVSGDTGALLYGVDRAAIDNTGLITGADIFSAGTVSVTNRAGGEIAGDSLGLLAMGPVVEITNGGTIASADTAAIDIEAPDRAVVHNTATGLVSAAAAPAVRIRASDTRVINDGQVTGASGFLIDGDATLTNTASGTIETIDTAVFVTGTATVVNAGQIITEAGVVPADVPDAAVAVGSGGSITNLEGGVILNRHWAGVSVTDGTGTDDPTDRETVIGNAGLIGSEGPGIGVRAQVAGGVTLSNAQSGTIAAAGARGVAIRADRIGVENAGTIVGEGGEGIVLVAADEATLDNAGTIIGGVLDTGGQLPSGVFAEGGNLDVVNREGGVIAGDLIGITLLAREVAAIENAGFTNGILVQGGDAALLTNAASGVVAADNFNGLVGDEVAVDNAGIINGGETGLIIQGETAGIVNTGRIDGVGSAGIVSAATGTTSIVNAGTITGALIGVAVDGVVAIDNAGTISGGGTAISATGGTVTNHAGGEIAGAVGISARGDDVGIVNAGGLIKGDQVAIAVEGDGTLVDNGAGAEITAQGDTIYLKGESLIVNAGTIRSTGAVAIIVEGDALVDNAEGGVIEAAGPAMILAGVTSLTNDGRISSTDPTFDGDDDDGVAVLAGSGGLIVNTGVIDSGAGAVLIGDVDTVADPAELETVIANDGLIQARGDGTALGADVEGAVAVVNSGTIAAEDGPAVDLVAADILLGNGGTIASEGDVGLAIRGGRVDVANAGVIAGAGIGLAVGGDVVTVDNQGEISGETGVVLRGVPDGEGDGGASQLTLVNRGTIDGGVVFQGGDSNSADIGGTVTADEAGRAVVFADGASMRDLIVEAGAAIGGDILAGTNNTLEQARLRQDSVARFSGAGRFEHDLQGFGLIDKTDAGTWRLDGDLLAAAFDITGGGVTLNGHYTGDRLSVGGAGTLSGTGRITGELINAGTVAPGNSIGTLIVTADYTQTGTGTLAMEYADDGAGGALTDRLVVGGAADIQGGTLALTSFDGSTPRYASAALLTAAGGVTGGFDRVETDRAGLLGGVLIEGDVISLRLVDTANGFRVLAETETARGVAGVLEAQALTATGDRDVLLTQLAALDDAGVAAALGDLAGTEYAGHWRYLRSTGRAFVDGATRAGAAGHRGAWITGFGNAGRTSGEDAVGDVRWRSAGTAVGIDFAVGEDARLGLAAGVTDGRMSARDRDAGIDTTGWHIGAYGAVPAGPVMLDAAVAFTRASSDASRSISGIGRTASGSFDTDQITASVGVSTDIVVPGAKPGTPEATAGAPAWTVTPMLRLTFDHQRSDDVTETGAGAAALRVEGATVQGLEAFAGLRFGASFGDAAAGDVVVRPSFILGIGQELLDRDNSLMASFADDPANRFKVNGVSQGRTTGRFGAEVAVDVAAGVTIGAAYAGSIDETGDDHRLTAGLRLSW